MILSFFSTYTWMDVYIGGFYSLGNKRIHFFCEKNVVLDTLAAVNIGYDKCPILETC